MAGLSLTSSTVGLPALWSNLSMFEWLCFIFRTFVSMHVVNITCQNNVLGLKTSTTTCCGQSAWASPGNHEGTASRDFSSLLSGQCLHHL